MTENSSDKTSTIDEIKYKLNHLEKTVNRTASEIVDDLQRIGLSLDPDTVRNWLRQAAELLDQKNCD